MKNRNDWHLLKKEKVLGLLKTDFYRGLDPKRVRGHRLRWGDNDVWYVRRTSAGEIGTAALLDLATLLLLISAAAAALFDRTAEAAWIAGILVCGWILRTVTYMRACRILEDMAKEKIPVASVIRGGRVCLIPAGEVVTGDIVYLEEGDTVPCDGRVIAGADSLVDEYGITENKEPVHKFDTVISTESAGGEVPCEYRSNCVFAGSRVLKGSLRIAATAVGSRTLIAMKQGGIEIEPDVHLPMADRLGKRSRNTSLIMLACVLLLTVLSMVTGDEMSLIDVFLSTMAMAAAAMCEFLSMVCTIIIGVTIRDSASAEERRGGGKSRAVIREPAKLESIAGIRKMVFCGLSFFKSGRMELCAYHTAGAYVKLDEKDSEYRSEKGEAVPAADRLLNLAIAASASENRSLAGGGAQSREASEISGIVLRAADAYGRKLGHPVEYGYGLMDHMDAGSKTAGMHLSLIVDGNDVRCAACGKIDAVLRACTMAETAAGAVPITDEIRRDIYKKCAELEFSGARVVAVSHRISPFHQLDRVTVLTEYMTFAGFIAVSQEPEKNASDHAAFMHGEGICPILFTADHEGDLYYGYRLGLFDKRTRVVGAADVTPDIFRDAPRGVIVSFAGAENLHRAYEAVMKAVAAEKDGITAAIGRKSRDAAVLAMADVSCAVADSPVRPVEEGLAGRSVMVVHPDKKSTEAGFGGLNGVMGAMFASRQAMENVESAKIYLAAAQTARLIMMLAAVLLPVPMLSPVGVLTWGLLFDFAAVLGMAFVKGRGQRLKFNQPEQDEDFDDEPRFGHGLMTPILTGLLWGAVTSGAVYLYGLLSGLAKLGWDSGMFLGCSLILSGLVVSCSIMKSQSLFRKGKLNTAYSAFALAALALIPVILLTADLVWLGRLLCLGMSMIPAAILLAAAELTKYARRKM